MLEWRVGLIENFGTMPTNLELTIDSFKNPEQLRKLSRYIYVVAIDAVGSLINSVE